MAKFALGKGYFTLLTLQNPKTSANWKGIAEVAQENSEAIKVSRRDVDNAVANLILATDSQSRAFATNIVSIQK